MPGENEIIESIRDNGTASVFDIASFAEESVEEPRFVSVTVRNNAGNEQTIKVPNSSINSETQDVDPTKISREDMEEIIEAHNLCWLTIHDEWAQGELDEFCYCEYDREWIWADDAVFGFTRDGEGYFHLDTDYVRCYDTDTCYYDHEVANDHYCYYCENCEEYRDEEHDHDECGEGSGESYFDNQRGLSCNRQLNQLFGMSSSTYSLSNSMQYTFGVEMETSRGNLGHEEYQDLNLKSVYDGSTSGPEYVTGVLKGDSGFKHLKKICDSISEDHEVNSRCGVHVHIGGSFNRRFTIMLLRLGYQLQDELFMMMPASRLQNSFCKYIPTWAGTEIDFQNWRSRIGEYIYGSETELDQHHNKKRRHDHYASTRYRWININNFSTASGKPTVEFRNHGASMNYSKIRNWVLICMSIVRYAENNQRTIWHNPELITLEEVLLESLGENLGKQVYTYYKKRVQEFKPAHAESNNKLPSQVIAEHGKIS